MFTQKDFKPKIFTHAESGIELNKVALRPLIGKRITNIFIVWALEWNEWFSDAPVVIEVDESIQLELLAHKMDEYSISFNKLDLTIKPKWGTIDLEWRPAETSSIVQIPYGAILGFTFVEHRMSFPRNSEKVRKGGWFMNALEINTKLGMVSVFNSLDENGLSNEPSIGEDYKRISFQ